MKRYHHNYFIDQLMASRFKNRIGFVGEHYKRLGFKNSIKYLYRYSPSLRMMVVGSYIIEGVE